MGSKPENRDSVGISRAFSFLIGPSPSSSFELIVQSHAIFPTRARVSIDALSIETPKDRDAYRDKSGQSVYTYTFIRSNPCI